MSWVWLLADYKVVLVHICYSYTYMYAYVRSCVGGMFERGTVSYESRLHSPANFRHRSAVPANRSTQIYKAVSLVQFLPVQSDILYQVAY